MNQIRFFCGNLVRPLCRLFCLQDVFMDFDDGIGLTAPNTQSFKRKRDEQYQDEDDATNAKKMRTTCETSNGFGCLQDVCIASDMNFDDGIGLTAPNTQSLKRKRDEHYQDENGATNAKKMRTTFSLLKP
jgi:hypothetical protein